MIERRAARWPWVLLAAVVLAVVVPRLDLGGGGGGGSRAGRITGGSDAPPPTVGIELDDSPAPPAEDQAILRGSGIELLVSEPSRLVTIELEGGQVGVVGDERVAGGVEQQPLVIADHFVIVKQFVAYAVDTRFTRDLLALGPANAVVADVEERTAWLIDLRRDLATPTVFGRSTAMSEQPVALPDGAWDPVGFAAGIVLTTEDRWVVVDGAGAVVRDQPGRALAAAGTRVAWLEPDCGRGPCALHVTDVRDGSDRRVDLFGGPTVTVNEAAFSGNGRWLAVAGDVAGDRSPYEVIVVDVQAPQLRVDAVAGDLETPPAVLSWSGGSRWLLWSRRAFGENRSVVTAVDLRGVAPVDLDLPAADILTFVAH